jgi:transcriptional regulator GlxA family with amidase domain
MSAGSGPVNVAILAMPEVTASTLYGMYDLFASAGRDWSFLTKGTVGEARMRPYVVAREPGFCASNSIWIRPEHGLGDCPAPAIVCIPDFFIAPGESCAGRFETEVAWLRRCHAAGATLASACAGAVLLAETGLLDGLDATIHWAYSEALTAHYPKVRVHADRTLVVNAEQRIVMGGGSTSWQDLTLFLIGRFVGLKEAIEVAKVYLVDWHDIGQRPFASLLMAKQAADALIAHCQEWAAMHYAEPSPVAAMVKLSGLPERSFIRRFAKATGLSPLDYVHSLRLEEAKQMLETEDLPVEAIANEVGYQDTSFFGRLFRRQVGLTPAQYRRRFASLRRALLASQRALERPEASNLE